MTRWMRSKKEGPREGGQEIERKVFPSYVWIDEACIYWLCNIATPESKTKYCYPSNDVTSFIWF